MNIGKYVFAQIARFLPTRYFERLVIKNKGRIARMAPSYWSHMLVIMFGQPDGCHSLRELTDITIAHAKRSFNLGFGKVPINRRVLSKANNLRDPGIFEKYAFHIVSPNVSTKSLNSTEGSMPLTPLPSTCACRYLDWQSSEAQSPASRFIPRLILPPKYRSSTESAMQMCMTPSPWTGLYSNRTLAMYLIEDILTSPDSSKLSRLEHFSSYARSFILIMKSRKMIFIVIVHPIVGQTLFLL